MCEYWRLQSICLSTKRGLLIHSIHFFFPFIFPISYFPPFFPLFPPFSPSFYLFFLNLCHSDHGKKHRLGIELISLILVTLGVGLALILIMVARTSETWKFFLLGFLTFSLSFHFFLVKRKRIDCKEETW